MKNDWMLCRWRSQRADPDAGSGCSAFRVGVIR
jgi:hypothetical protein